MTKDPHCANNFSYILCLLSLFYNFTFKLKLKVDCMPIVYSNIFLPNIQILSLNYYRARCLMKNATL